MKLLSIFAVSSYAALGDYYWNQYENYGLLGYIDHDPIETLEEAQELCISKGERCAGVTQGTLFKFNALKMTENNCNFLNARKMLLGLLYDLNSCMSPSPKRRLT